MKRRRLSAILDLIEKYAITTQEEMQNKLEEIGFAVTQATVSRDIKELHLLKALDSDGNHRYVNGLANGSSISPKFASIFSNSVIKIDFAMNDIVIKCYAGMANAACAAFDSMSYSEVVGTLAGDDTIFVITRTEKDAAELARELNDILG